MSRPIKFRAWDKKTNKKYFVSSIDMFGKVVTILDDRGDTLDFIERAIHNVELMQFTGLTDRNGVEIYEGDIMRRGTGYIFEMKLYTFSLGGAGYSSAYGYSHQEDDEVIGNVYENSDILERK